MALSSPPFRAASPGALLARAAALFDASELGAQVSEAWRAGFEGGGRWMASAMARLRGAAPRPPLEGPDMPPRRSYTALGTIKYGLASLAALVAVLPAFAFGSPFWLALVVPAFYAVEAQMVFLFPVAIDGSRRPFRDARALTVRAGGTARVMAGVLPLAASMLFGGLVGRGFLRSWCLGCLAVVLWYEAISGEEKQGRP